MIRIALVGAAGRMGAAVLRLSREADDLTLVGACDSPTSPHVGRDVGEIAHLGTLGVALSADVDSAILGANVCIDFSGGGAAAAISRAVAREGVAWVSGTTGIDAAGERALDHAARSVPVLWAPNMSAGVEVLAALVREAISRLGLGYDVEIVETHHRKKIDSPSGTAKRLADAARDAREDLRDVYGRDGLVGPRKLEEMAVLALRGGDVIGDHSVHLLGDGERIELTHRATNRDLFAHGALRAARFLLGKPAGRYTMRDVMEVSPPPLLN